MTPTDIPTFATNQLELLDRELQAELAETTELADQASPAALQRAGLALLNLHIGSQRTGLGGKTVLDLELDPAIGQGDLPEHSIRTGDIIGLRTQHGGAAKKRERAETEKKGVEGVVVKTTPAVIAIALDKEDADVPDGKLWLLKLANDVTYKRMNQTMTRLLKASESDYSPFVRVLFGLSSPTPVPNDTLALDQQVGELEWISESLNESQKESIKFAMASKEIALIHGPPGTGKTHTLVELILQLVKRGARLLVCGPSNISVDNIVERLASHKIAMVRLGHPARLLPSVMNHSLDILTKTSEAAALVQDVRKEMDSKQASIRKTRSGKERREIYADLKELRKEYRERERGCVDNLVQSSKVVLSTLHGAGGYQLRQAQFDAVIIDEASQALEAQCWVPLLSARKAILAGDHLQLPPTIKSINSKGATTKANSKGAEKSNNPSSPTLEFTMFDRLLSLHGPAIKRMLKVQYRMNEKIMEFPSQELYDSDLAAAEAVKDILLTDLPGVEETEDTIEPVVFYDTQSGDFPEKAEEEQVGKKSSKSTLLGESKSNEMEAALVHRHVQKLVGAGMSPENIAVITPYNAQLALLSQLLKEDYKGIELGSVDGFQGREKEAVIVSLVRSNPLKEVGFLAERRRLNVAMTRPKRHLAIVCDSATVSSGSKFLKGWMKWLEDNADLRYPDPADVNAIG